MNNEKKLINIFKSTFTELSDKDSDFIISVTKGDVASWDSGNHFMLITCIEEDFGISLTDELIVSITSFLDAYRTIEEIVN